MQLKGFDVSSAGRLHHSEGLGEELGLNLLERAS